MKKILFQVISATLGLYLASLFVPGVSIKLLSDSHFFGFHLTAIWQLFILLGIILGLLNFFVKPILDVITLPLRILTLGFFTIIINMALIFVLDETFRELNILLYLPLLYTTLIVWTLNLLFSLFNKDN